MTGAGSGIGAATAVALADAGAQRLVLVGRNQERLDRTAAAARAANAGVELATVSCDLSTAVGLASLESSTASIDILVNNAGANRPTRFVDVEAEVLDELLAINLRAPFLVAQMVARRMIADGRTGVIVNMSSQMGHVGAPDRSVYCATKHAIEGLTKALGVELASHGIRVVAVAPTFVETPLTRPFLDDDDFASSTLTKIPTRRFATTDEVAAAVVYLASPIAGSITGTSLLVDGGWTAH